MSQPRATTTGIFLVVLLAVVAALAIALGVAGEMSWMPTGHGWRWLASAIMGEVALSQETGAWRRMKQCRNPKCRATFYDSSWDNRGVCRLHAAMSVRNDGEG